MIRILHSTSVKAAIAAGSAVVLFAGGMAFAGGSATVNMNGGALVQTKVATNAGGFGPAADNVWENVPGSTVTVNVPSGRARLVTGMFSAESFCDATSWCSVRIVARKGAGNTLELHPRSGSEFAFDAPAADDETWESNAFARSLRLGSSGTWNVWVQARVVGSGDMFLDDWHFAVDVHKSS